MHRHAAHLFLAILQRPNHDLVLARQVHGLVLEPGQLAVQRGRRGRRRHRRRSEPPTVTQTVAVAVAVAAVVGTVAMMMRRRWSRGLREHVRACAGWGRAASSSSDRGAGRLHGVPMRRRQHGRSLVSHDCDQLATRERGGASATEFTVRRPVFLALRPSVVHCLCGRTVGEQYCTVDALRSVVSCSCCPVLFAYVISWRSKREGRGGERPTHSTVSRCDRWIPLPLCPPALVACRSPNKRASKQANKRASACGRRR